MILTLAKCGGFYLHMIVKYLFLYKTFYMKKRLIFNFYINEGWKENHINKIHLYCLKYFKDVFTEMTFMVSVNDVNNVKLIYEFEEYIISLHLCTDIKFIVKQNHVFREAQNFYDEVALKLKELDGLTFFAHNKGITNYVDSAYKKENVEKWITSMYYGCLIRPEESEYELTDGRKVSYGTLFDIIIYDYGHKEQLNLHLGDRCFFYMGTFFWLNCRVIDDFLRRSEKTVPTINDRWYAENFLANIIDEKYCGRFDTRYMIDYLDGGWGEMDKVLLWSFGPHLEDYLNFHNKVLENI